MPSATIKMKRVYEAASPEERFLWIAPSEGVTYGDVADTLNAATEAGFTEIRFGPPG